MTRLVLLVEGCFLILGSLLVLWWVSPGGHGVQREMGWELNPLAPRDVGLIASALFAGGYVLAGGFALQRFVGGVIGAVVGGTYDQREGQTRSMIAWGVFGYLVMAAIFGTFVLVVVEGSGAFERFTDPQFLRIVLTWPYHVMASMGLFGVPTEQFY